MKPYLKKASLHEVEKWRHQDPADNEVAARLAQILLFRNRDSEALQHIQEALRLRSDSAQYWYIQALILSKLGRGADAAESWERAVALSPIEGKAYMLGDYYLDRLDRPQDARRIYSKVIRYSGREPALITLRRLGQCCLQNTDLNEALLRIEQLISPFLAPIRALEALAQALAAEGRYNEARVCCDLLMAEDGNNLAALMAMATITSEQDHDLAAAENYYLRALASHFTDLDVHRNWMLHLVRAGDYERARRHFVDFFLKDPRRMPSVTGTPLPDHADLKEKKLLLVGRPGFGDYFQLLRFASFFHDRGAHVSVECVESLWDLLRTIPGIDGFTEEGAESTEFDYQADTWSVFLYFEDCLKLAEQRVPYILPPSSLADRWRSRLQQPDSVLKVGLAWSSSLASRNAHTCRNVPIRALDGLSRAANVKYYSLQFTSVKGSVGESGLQMINLAPELSPFIETAGAFVNLDLIVTVDSSVAHLAGALGTPTYVLLPYAPDPRWMLDGDTTPWYPATRLFRQTVPGDWSRPISQIAAAIEELAVARLRNLQMDNLAVTLR